MLYWIFSSPFSFAIFGVFIYLIFSNRSISRRLSVIEQKIKQGNLAVQPMPANLTQPPQSAPVAQSFSTPQNVQEEPNKFIIWLKEDWLMKLGAFLFIVGFGWFVSYAFANNWVGPIGRISIGIVAGVSIMAFGFIWMMKHVSQGAVFMALGAGMAMLTIFAGRSIYGFFTPISAVGFDFIIVAFVSFASYKFNVKLLAFLAQVLAFIAPLLTAGPTDSVFIFSYLLFISLATLVLASFTGWRELIISSLIFVGLYSIPYIGASYSYGGMYKNDAPLILNFAYLFSMLYLLAGMFAVVKKGVQNIKNEIILAVFNGLFLFMWIYNVAPKEWSVMLFATWAVVFVVSSFIAFRFSSELSPFYAYGSVAVAFIAAATAAQLDGASLVIAFTIEVLLLVLSVLGLTKNIKVTNTTSWLFIFPVMLSFASLSKYANSRELFTEDFFALTIIAISLVVAGRLIIYASGQNKDAVEVKSGGVLIILGTLYLGYIVWQFIHILISSNPDMATMVSLIIFTIFGLVAYFAGLYGNDMARRTYGIILLAFVILRLIVVDVWDMELFGKVVTFLVIGILLMSTAFLTKRKNHD